MVGLNPDNWSPSMRGETGQRPRYICRSCWSARQRKYGAKRSPEELRAMKNAARSRKEAAWTEERRVAEADRRYNSWLIREYGIDMARYLEILEKQNGACAICKSDKPDGKGRFHVDHCHATGAVRGLLCATCNLLLGHARDSTERLLQAAKYLADRGAQPSATSRADPEISESTINAIASAPTIRARVMRSRCD